MSCESLRPADDKHNLNELLTLSENELLEDDDEHVFLDDDDEDDDDLEDDDENAASHPLLFKQNQVGK